MASRYLPLLRLALGDKADVYLGVLQSAEGFQHPVILKRAFAGLQSVGNSAMAEARRELIAEASASLQLRHPNVVGATELAELPEGLVLVSEYVPGVSFHTIGAHLRDQGGGLPWPEACRFVADAAFGAGYVHRTLGRGHGDISARNVICDDEGFARIIDFGPVAHRLTPLFASPERARGGPPSPASDVYSLGLLLHLLVTGRAAFDTGEAESTLAAIAAGPSPIIPGPPAFQDVAAAMLGREPHHRPGADEAGQRLLDAAGPAGSRHAARTMLVAELGTLLERRRERVASVLSGEARMTAASSDTRTFSALESFFDADIPELDGTLVRR